MATRVRSYSKINLGLAVGPARPDGFHGLTTVYQTLALHDLVTVSANRAAKTTITLSANHRAVPTSEAGTAERNTAYRMVALALARLGVEAAVSITIDKHLPVQGGMGAGSANAVAALIGLERELGRALPGAERIRLAAEIGSDVPLFLLGGTVLGVGRGEQVYPLPDLPPMACVVAVPEVGVSTAAAFAELDRRDAPINNTAAPTLTFQQGRDRLAELSHALSAVWSKDGVEAGPSGIVRSASSAAGQPNDLAESLDSAFDSSKAKSNPLLALVRTGIENDFEKVVFSQYPSLRSTRRDLLGVSGDPGSDVSSGATKHPETIVAALSGSGSALFGLYETVTAARAAQQRVQSSGMQAILTETLPRQSYWDAMIE